MSPENIVAEMLGSMENRLTVSLEIVKIQRELVKDVR